MTIRQEDLVANEEDVLQTGSFAKNFSSRNLFGSELRGFCKELSNQQTCQNNRRRRRNSKKIKFKRGRPTIRESNTRARTIRNKFFIRLLNEKTAAGKIHGFYPCFVMSVLYMSG